MNKGDIREQLVEYELADSTEVFDFENQEVQI
jgi:hypothetical protein